MHLNTLVRMGFALTLMAPLPANASSSDWIETEGGRVRLVSSGQADADGLLRAALQIVLAPGWKTYWRDPGDAGIAPRLDVAASTNVAEAQIAFPAPERLGDAYSQWAGYAASVNLPVRFWIADPERFAFVEADLLMGICATVCIPVSATILLDPDSAPGAPDDVALVDEAFAALPAPAHAGFGIVAMHLEDSVLHVEAAVPEGAHGPSLFLAGNGDWSFAAPQTLGTRSGRARFAVPVLRAPREKRAATAEPLQYTLVSGHTAVSGSLAPPMPGRQRKGR